MSKAADLQRWQDTKFWWPKDKAVQRLHQMLDQLAESEDTRFVVQLGINEHGHLAPWICVEHGDEPYEGYNDLFPCPPRC
jgi:hypothetical protein